MTLRNVWGVCVGVMAIGAVAFFAACGDDDESRETCPAVFAGGCQYDGNNLVDCDSTDAATICTGTFDCLDSTGAAVAAGEDGVCASNTAPPTETTLWMPGINWETLRKA